MLTRQKVLLALLQQIGRPVSRTVFVKMIFLLRQETALMDDETFYGFVPYKYGPFSFGLYRELSALQNQGYVLPGEEQLALASGTQELIRRAITDLPMQSRQAVASIASEYGVKGQNVLLKQVYAKYPWYASNTELEHLRPAGLPNRPMAEIATYTVGYEGRSVDQFFDTLLRAGIRAILDVRANPVSRKYGFAKKSLQDICHKLGLEYSHLPELGIPSDQRAALTSRAAYEELLDRYEQEVLPTQLGAMLRLVGLLKKNASVLLCMERDAARCHRGRLAKAVAARAGLPIVHL